MLEFGDIFGLMRNRSINFIVYPMKTIYGIIYILIITIVVGCNVASEKNADSYDYETMYKDSFDILIKRCGEQLELADTLYTEMYMALKTCGEDSLHLSKASCDIVLDRVDKLMKIDTIKANQRRYLYAQMKVYSMMHDFDKFMETEYLYWNTYPANHIERLSGMGVHFLVLQNQDSANYYLNKAISSVDNFTDFSDTEDRLSAIMGKATSLILLKRDREALVYLQEQVRRENDEEGKEMLESIISDFDEFKKQLWSEIGDLKERRYKE